MNKGLGLMPRTLKPKSMHIYMGTQIQALSSQPVCILSQPGLSKETEALNSLKTHCWTILSPGITKRGSCGAEATYCLLAGALS